MRVTMGVLKDEHGVSHVNERLAAEITERGHDLLHGGGSPDLDQRCDLGAHFGEHGGRRGSPELGMARGP